jgi:ADP-heptose:LPS heptosyltransferase
MKNNRVIQLLSRKFCKEEINMAEVNDINKLSKRGSLYIRVPGGYGDNLMATAVVAAVKREYPDMRIFVATKRPDIFENNPHIAGLYNTRTLLKKNMSIYNRCCILEYVPYAKIRESNEKKHWIDFFYDCLPISIKHRTYQPEIYLTRRERNYRSRQLERLQRPIAVISPYGGATTKIPNKLYPVEKWPAIVAGLSKAGFSVIQVGEKKEGPVLRGAIDFRDIGYRKSAAVLLHSDVLITHTSGFMHLATALNVPCLTLFGGVEDPNISGYKQNPNLTVALECAPCWLPKPCDNPRCKELLSPEKIVAATIEFVESNTLSPHNKES